MYQRHFGLTAAPFRITPDTRRFFGGGKRAEILETLKYAIMNGEGMVKVTGEVGTGKTMLCRMLQDQLPDSVEIVYLANPRLSRDEILAAIALELRLPSLQNPSHLLLQHQLQNYLLDAHGAGRRIVVFIEEAQRMPLETLEEIRLLSNLETREAKLLQLVLFAQPEINQLLDRYEIRQLRDRISHNFHLSPLSAAEVQNYVRFRLHSAGYRGDELFTRAACRQLALSCNGLIRRMHVLAEKALLAAFSAGSRRVRWIHVWRARADDRAPASRLQFPPKGLLAGLVAGFALIMIGARVLPVAPETAHESDPAAVSSNQNLTATLRAAALKLRPAAGGMPLVSRRLQASREWLQQPADGQLTIQLLLTENDDLQELEKLLSNQAYNEILAELYLYRSEVAGRQRWNLLYGEFDSKTEALAALADLPTGARSHQPFLRSLAALRTAQQASAPAMHKDEQG